MPITPEVDSMRLVTVDMISEKGYLLIKVRREEKERMPIETESYSITTRAQYIEKTRY